MAQPEVAMRHQSRRLAGIFGLQELPKDNIVKDSGKLCWAMAEICCTAHNRDCSCC